MEKLNLPFVYQLGHELRRVTTLGINRDEAYTVVMAFSPLQSTLPVLFKQFPSLKVSRPVGAELTDLIQAFFKNWSDTLETVRVSEPIPPSAFRLWAPANNAIQKAIVFENVLNAELQSLVSYQVTQTGIYSVSDLVENAEDVFPSGLKKRLSDDATREIRESGRCLALGVGTACGFHILRATEVVMHDYYTKICNQGIKCDRLDNWGAYITRFRKSEDTDAKRIAEMLQQVKDHDRNLIMHPEVSLDADEAHTLFELAKGSIMAMAEKL